MTERTDGNPGFWRVFHDKFVVEERYMSAAARTRLYRVAIALMLLGSVLFFVTLGDILNKDGIAGTDDPMQSWLLSQRSEPLTTAMIILAVIFGPVVLPIIILVVTVAWGLAAKHAWRPILLAAGMLTGVVLAQIIGRAVGRSRPPIEQMLFGPDSTFSFPSGHVLGAADFLLITVFLVFSRRKHIWPAAIGYAAAAVGIFFSAISRLYLGYHWVSDALASVSLSMVILGAVIAVDTWRTARIPGEKITGELSKADTSTD
ncbi:phosphatase PAP2 family protein [Arthrobacter rhizosphaerae]|uniref:phosphatase PAP2 family protein n=1 Tax=Arthrobacter rhizosphaerae TaxID=2855490 RepID=UPI001FF16094|nr:phosphatase PAP2 family protein [Arthrobacter rhizosphaerae]